VSVFYRSSRALITDELFVVAAIGNRRYAIRDLRGIRILRQESDGGSGSRRVLGMSALVSGLLIVPSISRESTVLAAVVVAGLLLYAGYCLRAAPPAKWNLVAFYRGELTTLFVSEDQREFDQVCRGLQRCLEHLGRRM
jgi:hypothetical protein